MSNVMIHIFSVCFIPAYKTLLSMEMSPIRKELSNKEKEYSTQNMDMESIESIPR